MYVHLNAGRVDISMRGMDGGGGEEESTGDSLETLFHWLLLEDAFKEDSLRFHLLI